MAVSRMSEPLFLGDPDEGNIRPVEQKPQNSSPKSTRRQMRKDAKKTVKQVEKDVVLTNEFLNSLRREIHNSGIDVTNIDEVMTFTENKRLQLVKIVETINENDTQTRFNLFNMIGFLRRMQERSEDFLKVVSRPPPAKE